EQPTAPPTPIIKKLTADTIAQWVHQYHTALQPLRTNITQAEQQLRLQKANRTPDLTVAVGYDRGGSIMGDFIGVCLSKDLPLFDRNQGQIKSAQLEMERRRLDLEYTRHEVTGTAIDAWQN